VVENGWVGPQFRLAAANDNMDQVKVQGWLQYEVAEELFNLAGMNLAEMSEEAAKGSVEPTPMGLMASVNIRNTIVRAESYNVGAILPGSARADELFIYMAHWDHLGTAPHQEGQEGDFIYNGALDNASGTAGMIEIAEVFTSLPTAPQRSVGFLAVTAEESGLLGSKAFVADPPFPMHKTAGGVNMDGLNFLGRMSDIVVKGYGSSEMENILAEVALPHGRTLTPESTPEKGSYYRSDHFNFARQGVPILYAGGGTVDRTHGSEYVAQRNAEYIAKHYHDPSDEIRDDWDLDAAIEDLVLYYEVGKRVADSDDWPQWYEGNEFRAIREASLAEAGE
jgi:Zn-dependent M28 family amino/carboxypeptidase